MADPVAPPEHKESNARMIVLGLLIALVVLFFILNNDEVKINFIVATTTTSLFWALILSTLAGIIIGWLFAHSRARRKAAKTH
jgi:uncharacterized integral membrane protein